STREWFETIVLEERIKAISHCGGTRMVRPFLACGLLLTLSLASYGDDKPEPQVYEVYAVRYAVLRGGSVSFLVQGADPQRKIALPMIFGFLKAANGRIVLVDAVFYRPKPVQSYGPANFEQPDRALARLSIDPKQVTDVIITHMHSDH